MDGGVADTTSQDVSRLVDWQKVVGESVTMISEASSRNPVETCRLVLFWMTDGDAFADARDALGTFRAAAEGLHARLGRAPDGSSAAGSSARESIDDVLHCSAEVQAAIAKKRRHARTGCLRSRSACILPTARSQTCCNARAMHWRPLRRRHPQRATRRWQRSSSTRSA